MNTLEGERLHKSFGKLEVLRGIDLELAEHEVVCLIGASGSGKSTLLRCINLLEPIEEGRIVLQGDVITARGALPLGRLSAIINQDTMNIPAIQKGLKVLSRTQDSIPLASYQESRIRHFHHTLTKWMEKD